MYYTVINVLFIHSLHVSMNCTAHWSTTCCFKLCFINILPYL